MDHFVSPSLTDLAVPVNVCLYDHLLQLLLGEIHLYIAQNSADWRMFTECSSPSVWSSQTSAPRWRRSRSRPAKQGITRRLVFFCPYITSHLVEYSENLLEILQRVLLSLSLHHQTENTPNPAYP